MSIFLSLLLTFAPTVCIPICDMVSTKGAKKGAEPLPLVSDIPVWALHPSANASLLLFTTASQWFDQTRSYARVYEHSYINSSADKTNELTLGLDFKSALPTRAPPASKFSKCKACMQMWISFSKFAKGNAALLLNAVRASMSAFADHAMTVQLSVAYVIIVPAVYAAYALELLALAVLRVGVLMLLYAGAFAVLRDVATGLVGLMILALAYAPRSAKGLIRMLITCVHALLFGSLERKLDKIILVQLVYLAFSMLIPGAEAVGRETPKLTMHEYFLPGVTTWDSFPFHDFRRVWYVALCAALGNINQEGWTLLQTARDEDIGSPGNPGTPAQAVQSQNRNQRLFGAILNYIEATSYLYSFVSNTFANDGRGLWNYIWEVGHLPYTLDERTKLENEWTDATMSSVGIQYVHNAVFKWADWVEKHASKLGKDETQKRQKYLQGFPSAFDVMVVTERSVANPGSHVHPAVYPAHHPDAGNPHPNAGEPNIHACARHFYTEWSRMIDCGLIKRA